MNLYIVFEFDRKYFTSWNFDHLHHDAFRQYHSTKIGNLIFRALFSEFVVIGPMGPTSDITFRLMSFQRSSVSQNLELRHLFSRRH
jgi:hypothetical protein